MHLKEKKHLKTGSEFLTSDNDVLMSTKNLVQKRDNKMQWNIFSVNIILENKICRSKYDFMGVRVYDSEKLGSGICPGHFSFQIMLLRQ